MRKSEQGFTLVELLVVVAIIGIIAAIAIPQYAAYKTQAADTQATSDLKNMSTALEGYFVQVNTYAGATVALMKDYGFRQTASVTIDIPTKDDSHYVVTASALGGSGTMTLDSNVGRITGP